LVCAAAAGQLGAAQWLVSHGADQAHISWALGVAAQRGHIHILRYLLGQVDNVTEQGLLALQHAVLYNRTDSVKVLLAAGLPLSPQVLLDATGWEPLTRPRGQSSPRKRVVQLLLHHWAGQLPPELLEAALNEATAHKRLQVARLLLLAGAPMSQATGRQLLVWARILKYRAMMVLLGQRGVHECDL
jgi:ankyrin repeat protein